MQETKYYIILLLKRHISQHWVDVGQTFRFAKTMRALCSHRLKQRLQPTL